MQGARKEQGAVMVEFALVLVPLLIVVLGIIQFGLVLNAKIDETHLTRDGARYAAVNQNPDPGLGSLQDYILSKADTQDLRDNAQVCLDFLTNPETGTSGEVGDPVEMTMSYTYNLLPFLGNKLATTGLTVDVVSRGTMRLEAPPDDIDAGCTS